jgi:hypothetical protein
VTPPSWDPPIQSRVYYRHSQTSDLGWLVRRENKDAIKYDRPDVDQFSFNVNDWTVQTARTDKYSEVQIGQICFEADKKLCWALGFADLAKREWLDLTEKARVKWMKDGPAAKDTDRAALYAVIKAHLKATS